MTAKAQRQRLIADWLRGRNVGGQDEIVAKLGETGIAATQATVSRDLVELGAVRLRRDGAVRYVLPDQVEPDHAAAKLDRLLAEWVDSVTPSGNLLVLRTPPGSANLVANAIDAAGLAEVAGTIAGDDTIFIALNDGVTAEAAARMLLQRRGAVGETR